jgi:hypothetical protein
LQFNFATLDPPQVPFGPFIVSEQSGAGKSRSQSCPFIFSPVEFHRATDSRSHLPMSAEPFLVSERVAENVRAHVSKYTTRAAGQFRIVGRSQRASRAAHIDLSKFSTVR